MLEKKIKKLEEELKTCTDEDRIKEIEKEIAANNIKKNAIPFLDDVDLSKIKETEKKIYLEVKSSNPEIIDAINNSGKLEPETEKKLISVIEKFKNRK